jgi:hypothetical protein
MSYSGRNWAPLPFLLNHPPSAQRVDIDAQPSATRTTVRERLTAAVLLVPLSYDNR